MASAETNIDEKLAEEIRKYSVLYDKECADFKDKVKKKLAWNDVAHAVGLTDGKQAETMFRYLRNRYTRDKKKLKSKKVSGAGKKDVDDAKSSVSELFPYLAWLDPYVKPRATKTNLTVNVESNQTEEEDEVNEGDDNESTVSGISTPSNLSASSAGTGLSQVTGRPKYMKKSKVESPDMMEDVKMFKEIGSSLLSKAYEHDKIMKNKKDEDGLFTELLESQLKKMPEAEKVHVKMRINQLIYEYQLKAANPVEKQWPNSHHPHDRSSIQQTSQMQASEQQLSGQFNTPYGSDVDMSPTSHHTSRFHFPNTEIELGQRLYQSGYYSLPSKNIFQGHNN